MKYKPGDKVKIKSLDWYNANKDEDGRVMCDGIVFHERMIKLCGKELTIDLVYTNDEDTSLYIMKEPETQWRFTDSMIEGLVDEQEEKMVSLEDVCDFLNEHLYTGTSTDDYDYGQEYICSDFDNASDLIFALRKAMGD